MLLISLLLACPPPVLAPDSEATGEPVDLITPPYAQVLADGRLRLRFEVLEDERPLPLTLLRGDEAEEVWPERSAGELTYAWPTSGADEVERPDLPGLHVLHELLIDDLAPGDTLGWTLDLGGGERLEGSVQRPSEERPLTVAFFGDTMAPTTEALAPIAATYAPDLLLHGGDIQYQSNPFDTWARSFHSLGVLTAMAPYHPTPGNHEDEGQDEFTVMYARYFAGAGDSAGPHSAPGEGWHAFTWAGVRFIGLDTEGQLDDPESEQLVWLAAELEAHRGARATIVYFHRPIFTFGAAGPRDDFRAALHPLLVDGGVDLVLQAHNHSYERFIVDGLTYIVDGGGGAFLYDVNAQVEERPDEVAWRQVADRSFGFTLFTIDGEGVDLRRVDKDGELVDSARAPLR